MSKTDPDARTSFMRFRIGDVFDPADPIARWTTVLAMAINDTVYVNVRLIEGGLPAELRAYYVRLLASHFYESAVWLRDTRGHWPEVDAFVGSLDADAQRKFATVAAFTEQQHPLHAQLRRCRVSLFHYPQMQRARAERGIEDLANAMRDAADVRSSIEAAEDYASFRAVFADEIGTRFLAPGAEDVEEILDALQNPTIELVEFGEAALFAHLKRVDPKRIELEMPQRLPLEF